MEKVSNELLITAGAIIAAVIVVVYIINSIIKKTKKNKYNKLIIDMERRISDLSNNYTIKQTIRNIKTSDFYHDNEKINQLEKVSNDLYKKRVYNLSEEIFRLEEYLSHYQFKGINETLENLDAEVIEINEKLAKVQEEISFMNQEIKSRQIVYEKIAKKYSDLIKEFLTQEKTIKFMQKTLSEIFLKCKNQIENYRMSEENTVDPSLIEIELEELANKMERRKQLNDEINQFLQEDDPKVKEQITKALEKITTFSKTTYASDYELKRNEIIEIFNNPKSDDQELVEKLLDDLYAIIENITSFVKNEAKAKEKVSNNNSDLKINYTEMIKLLDKNHHEYAVINKKILDEEFEKERIAIDKIVADLRQQYNNLQLSNDLTFQTMQKIQEELIKEMAIINERQTALEFEYSKLADVEKSAREDYLMANKYLLESKALINNENLPKIPDNYYLLEENVENSVNIIREIFNREQVDEFILKQKDDELIENIEKLNKYIVDLIKNKRRAEQLITYVNRFNLNDAELEISRKAVELFDDGAYISTIKTLRELIKQQQR